jgi:hypothetical protein
MKINEVIISETDKQFKIFNRMQPRITNWVEKGVERWHIIYLNDDPNLCIHMAGFSNNFIPQELNFQDVFNAIKRKHYADLLLLVTYYGHIHNDLLVDKINKPKVPIDELTTLLFNDTSNGYLAYAHQLEQIYTTLTGATSNEANKFRKEWNKKSESTINTADTILYDRTKSLSQYIIENAFFSEGPFFLSANFRQAKLLYESILN